MRKLRDSIESGEELTVAVERRCNIVFLLRVEQADTHGRPEDLPSRLISRFPFYATAYAGFLSGNWSAPI